MFDDPKQELKKLEQQLLAAEDDPWLDEELAQARELAGEEYEIPAPRKPLYRNYANGYGQEDAFADDEQDSVYSDEYEEEYIPRERGTKGLIALACLEILGIIAVVIYWLVWIL